MIAPRNLFPLVEDQHGEVRSFESGWLLAALERAAVKAGFVEWWLAEHVLSSVCSYLGGFYTRNVVKLGRLQEAVRGALRDIGYVEIAHYFEAESPAAHVSLLRCARSTDTSGMPAFHHAVAMQVDLLQRGRLSNFHFFDLAPCLRYLNDAGFSEKMLRPVDVVGPLQDKIASLSWECEVHYSIS